MIKSIRRKMDLIVILMITLFILYPLSAYSSSSWVKSYALIGDEYTRMSVYAISAQQTSDGGYIDAGWYDLTPAYDTDALVFKLDQNGSLQWGKTYGALSVDALHYIRETSDRNYIAVGESSRFSENPSNYHVYNKDAFVMKIDPNGEIIWQKNYNSCIWVLDSANNTYDCQSVDWFEAAHSIQETSDGGYVVAGANCYSPWECWPDVMLLKLDGDGNLQWSQIYGIVPPDGWPVSTGVNSITQTSDGGYIATGTSHSHRLENALVLKLHPQGNIQWAKAYGGPEAEGFNDIKQTPDGGFIAVGGIATKGTSWTEPLDLWVVKLYPDGGIEWQKSYSSIGQVYARDSYGVSVQLASDGGYAVGGVYFESYGYGVGNKAWIMKLDTQGNIIWQKTYGGYNSDLISSMAMTDDGGYVLSGISSSFWECCSGHHWILKLDGNGNVPDCSIMRVPDIEVGAPVAAAQDIAIEDHSWRSIHTLPGNLTAKNTTITEIEICYAGDSIPPVIEINDCPQEVTLNASALVSVNVTDNESGVAVQSALNGINTLDTSTVGSRIFTVTAQDNAGNSGSNSCTYRVIYDFLGAGGFRSPVDNPPITNTAKAGSTIPVKWQLPDGKGGYISDISVVTSTQAQQVACSNTLTDAVETTSTEETLLHYDFTTNQYIYNWKTYKTWAGKCYILNLKLNDGSLYKANFSLK
jgi:hypothetical protein